MAKKQFALHTSPHEAEIGDVTLQLLPEVMGDEFLDNRQPVRAGAEATRWTPLDARQRMQSIVHWMLKIVAPLGGRCQASSPQPGCGVPHLGQGAGVARPGDREQATGDIDGDDSWRGRQVMVGSASGVGSIAVILGAQAGLRVLIHGSGVTGRRSWAGSMAGPGAAVVLREAG